MGACACVKCGKWKKGEWDDQNAQYNINTLGLTIT